MSEGCCRVRSIFLPRLKAYPLPGRAEQPGRMKGKGSEVVATWHASFSRSLDWDGPRSWWAQRSPGHLLRRHPLHHSGPLLPPGYQGSRAPVHMVESHTWSVLSQPTSCSKMALVTESSSAPAGSGREETQEGSERKFTKRSWALLFRVERL